MREYLLDIIRRDDKYRDMYLKSPVFHMFFDILQHEKEYENQIIDLIYQLCKSNQELTEKLKDYIVIYGNRTVALLNQEQSNER